MERLDLPSVSQPVEDLAASSLVNAKLIQQGIDRLGVNLLKAVTSRAAVGMAALTKTALPDFQASVRTSGGLIVVYAASYVTMNNETQGAYLTLRVDDLEVMTTGLGTNAGLSATVPLLWVGELPAGQHTFKLFGQATNATYGLASADSTMYVIELMRG